MKWIETGKNTHDYLPPTSVIIQSGIARLTIAKTSAAMNNVPDITVSLSIAANEIQCSEITLT